MPRVELPFAEGFYVSQSPPLIEKRAVNVYPVIPEADAASRRVLLHSPGIEQILNTGIGSSRGAIVFSDGTLYRVIGNILYSFDSVGNTTGHGTISGTFDVSMDSNGVNIAIIDPAGDGYFFTPSTNILERITDPVFLGFGQSTSVTFKDGFYVYTTDAVFFSGSSKVVNDGKDFNALDFADAEISPDIIKKGFNDHNQLYIFGETTTDVYQTIVTPGFPFQRIPGAMIPKGVSSRNTVIAFDSSFMFMGSGLNEKPAIYQALSSSIKRVSTRSIEHLIHDYDDTVISKARAFSYSEDGNYFAVFTIGDHTFVYDQTTSKLSGLPSWHERQTGVTDGVGYQKWRAVHGVKAFGQINVGDDRSGRVGRLDSDLYTEYDDPIEKLWTTKPFITQGDGIFSKEVELFMQTGLGNAEVISPQIRMDYSDDGSRTFTSEISRSLGGIGEYKTRVRWKRLGRIANTRVLRWKVTDPVPINVYGLFANAEAETLG